MYYINKQAHTMVLIFTARNLHVLGQISALRKGDKTGYKEVARDALCGAGNGDHFFCIKVQAAGTQRRNLTLRAAG